MFRSNLGLLHRYVCDRSHEQLEMQVIHHIHEQLLKYCHVQLGVKTYLSRIVHNWTTITTAQANIRTKHT